MATAARISTFGGFLIWMEHSGRLEPGRDALLSRTRYEDRRRLRDLDRRRCHCAQADIQSRRKTADADTPAAIIHMS